MLKKLFTKICWKCEKRKRISSFYKDKYANDGLQGSCKACQIKQATAWNNDNHDRRLKVRREWNRNTISGFLSCLYGQMRRRVEGRSRPKKYAHYWKGKPIMPKEIFYEWSKNHPDFIRLYKRWIMSDKDRKLVPSINRINSDKGYTLDNVEWVTSSQNSALASSVGSFNKRRAVYALLGDKNV